MNYLILTVFQLFAQENMDLIKNYDKLLYRPESKGLKNLTFDLRVDKLAQYLTSTETMGKIDNVYFRFYWTDSGNSRVMVEGLPPGLNQIRDDLTARVVDKFDYIFPKPTSKLTSGYVIKSQKTDKSTTTIELEDPEHLKDIDRMTIIFSGNKLTSLKMTSPYQVQEYQYEYLTQDGSLLFKKITLKSTIDGISTWKETSVKYHKQENFIMPQEIEEQNFSNLDKKDLVSVNRFTFSNYKIDSGKK